MIDLGTVARHFENQWVKIGYFNAPITNLNGFKYGEALCERCNIEQKLFTLNPNRNPSPDWICIDCLKNIEIECGHDTAFGYVDLKIPEGVELPDAIYHVSRKAYLEMRGTPSYLTIQGERWMCHCQDFMDYIGTWEAPDFTRESEDGSGKRLFQTMTIDGYHHLWDDSELADNEKENTWIDVLYHVFECRHCKIKQGYWEY